jgi:hypothetical protein
MPAHSGWWGVLHGATLVTTGTWRVAVIIESAHPARIGALVMAASGLTQREQEVTRPLLQGNFDGRDRRTPGGLGAHRAAASQERV